MLRVVAMLLLSLLAVGISSCGTSEADGTVQRVGAREAVAVIEGGDHVVLDLRSPEAFDAGHVAGADNLDAAAADFAEEVEGLDPERPYLVYARDAALSGAAAEKMVGLGIGTVVDAGGFGALALAGAPLEE
jgi:phage shock protein E